jgi:hypothetical protein
VIAEAVRRILAMSGTVAIVVVTGVAGVISVTVVSAAVSVTAALREQWKRDEQRCCTNQ